MGLIEELHKDGWHIGEQPFAGPPSPKNALGRSKIAYEALGESNPKTREEFAAVAPVREHVAEANLDCFDSNSR
jgi:4-oxalocrotonate tautomerase